MGVDVVDVVGVPAGVAEGGPHRLGRADALLVRGGDVVGVGRVAAAEHLGVDRRAARLRVLVLFEDQDAGPFAEDEAVAVLVERPAGALRVVVASERARQAMKPPRPIGVIAASLPPVTITSAWPQLDGREGVADGVGGRGAGGGDGGVRAATGRT